MVWPVFPGLCYLFYLSLPPSSIRVTVIGDLAWSRATSHLSRTNDSWLTFVTGQNLSVLTVASREPSSRENTSRSSPVRGLRLGLTHHPEVSNGLIYLAGSVLVLDTDDEAEVFTEYALASAITTLVFGPAQTTGGTPDKPPLKVLLADGDAVTSRLREFARLFPPSSKLGRAPLMMMRFDLILTNSKELGE